MQKQIQEMGLVVLGAWLLIPFGANAAEQRGTAEQAQALVAKAIAYYDENGRDAAFSAIEDKQGEFVNHDLYIFVYGPGRTIVAHGADANLNGTPVDTLFDIHGKPFGSVLMNNATEDGVWIDYTWYNPVGRELHPKSSWVVRHDGNVFGAGIYLQDDDASEPLAVEEEQSDGADDESKEAASGEAEGE